MRYAVVGFFIFTEQKQEGSVRFVSVEFAIGFLYNRCIRETGGIWVLGGGKNEIGKDQFRKSEYKKRGH